jgi:hypothetical protein
MRNTEQNNPIQQVIDTATQGTHNEGEPLQLRIDVVKGEFRVTLRTLSSHGQLDQHGSPVMRFKDKTFKTMGGAIRYVNKYENIEQVKGFRFYGWAKPAAMGVKVSDFRIPHITDTFMRKLEKEMC